MTDRTQKRPNPYFSKAIPLSKRHAISLESNSEQQDPCAAKFDDDGTPKLGSKTGIHFNPPSKNENSSNKTYTHGRFKYGNYINYYTTRRSNSIGHDPRLAALEGSLFAGKSVLDIGCNSGNITISLARNCKPKHILGVDIDKSLIQKATAQLRTVYSLQQPEMDDSTTPNPDMTFDVRLQTHYFPRSMAVMYANVPMAVPPGYDSETFPSNVSFEAGDWMDMDTKTDHYDTILALSITKWIQLHRGDEGIKSFFRKIHQSLRKGGVFVLEPQSFNSYHRRAKTSEDMAKNLEQIVFTPEQYHDYLMEDLGFHSSKQLETSDVDSKGFSRPLYLFTK